MVIEAIESSRHRPALQLIVATFDADLGKDRGDIMHWYNASLRLGRAVAKRLLTGTTLNPSTWRKIRLLKIYETGADIVEPGSYLLVSGLGN
ncbi:hypothetical protein [Nocardia colli]|uniref:hypothetical protein n=1 Tax=Nocardia colli TaxID=2545717 RepID=UPI0035E3BA52